MKTNRYGEVLITEKEAFDALYAGTIEDLENIYIDNIDIINKYNKSQAINADRIPILNSLDPITKTIEEFDKENQLNWFMPNDYCTNLIEYLYRCCTTTEQTDRVSLELELFAQHNMIDLLFYLKYLVDTMREHKIIWGVGRGSSVSSYILFLIGVHKIDSLLYQLDIREFLK